MWLNKLWPQWAYEVLHSLLKWMSEVTTRVTSMTKRKMNDDCCIGSRRRQKYFLNTSNLTEYNFFRTNFLRKASWMETFEGTGETSHRRRHRYLLCPQNRKVNVMSQLSQLISRKQRNLNADSTTRQEANKLKRVYDCLFTVPVKDESRGFSSCLAYAIFEISCDQNCCRVKEIVCRIPWRETDEGVLEKLQVGDMLWWKTSFGEKPRRRKRRLTNYIENSIGKRRRHALFLFLSHLVILSLPVF